MILIGKVNDPVPEGFTAVRCDRKTILGNPYSAKRYGRDGACDKFYQYFYSRVKVDKEFRETVWHIAARHLNGEKIILTCWCYPKRCHTMTIRDYCLTLAIKHLERKRRYTNGRPE